MYDPAASAASPYICPCVRRLSGCSLQTNHFWGGCGSVVEPASCYQKVAGLISLICISKCPWATYWTPNCSWRAGRHLTWQPPPSVYEWIKINESPFGQKCLLNLLSRLPFGQRVAPLFSHTDCLPACNQARSKLNAQLYSDCKQAKKQKASETRILSLACRLCNHSHMTRCICMMGRKNRDYIWNKSDMISAQAH